MEYEKPSEEIEIEEGIEPTEERALEEFESPEEIEEGAEVVLGEEEELNVKEKARPSDQHTLEVRRAIEDHVERIRLRKELDHLFDEHFVEEEDDQVED